MTDLQALHQALSEAECGSRELDFEIARQVCGLRDSGLPNWMRYDDDGARYIGVEAVPAFTTDLNAITSLIEGVLPGWEYGFYTYKDCHKVGHVGQVSEAMFDTDDNERFHKGGAAMAMCLALVSALIAQEGEG